MIDMDAMPIAQGPVGCRVSQPRVRTIERREKGLIARYKQCDIYIDRDRHNQNWYIVVQDQGGYKLYDGYWADSADKTLDDAIVEACRGSQLWTANTELKGGAE